jgi:hypothetical protein
MPSVENMDDLNREIDSAEFILLFLRPDLRGGARSRRSAKRCRGGQRADAGCDDVEEVHGVGEGLCEF